MSEWQPIETAPKDGSVFMGWIGQPWLFAWEDGKRWCGVVPYGDHYARMWLRFSARNQPSHWMPLPDPPSDS